MDDYGYIKYAWLVSEISMILVAIVYFGYLSLGTQLLEAVYIAGGIAGGLSIYDKLMMDD